MPLHPVSQQNNWANNLVESFFKREFLHLQAVAPIDQSLIELEELAQRGYTEVQWKAPNAQCYTCQDLHNQIWPIAEFIWFTKYEAPIFSKSHVGCHCFLKLTGIDKQTNTELPEQIIVAF